MHFHAEDFISITNKIYFPSVFEMSVQVDSGAECKKKLPLTKNQISLIMFYRCNNLPSSKFFCTYLISEDLQKLSSVV